MSTEKTEAIVIRQADFSESSRVVTLFTRDFGKVSAVAKGAKRLKGPFDAALDLLAASRIVFIRKSSGGLDILTEAQLISRFRPDGHDLFRLYAGYYLAELLNGLAEEYDPHPTLYEESVQTLRHLAGSEHPRLAVVRFELILLREIGQLPSLEECLICGRPASIEGTFVFWVSQGGLICRNCQSQEYPQNRIHQASLSAIRHLSQTEGEVDLEALVQSFGIGSREIGEMRSLTGPAIAHNLGRRPKMTRYLTF